MSATVTIMMLTVATATLQRQMAHNSFVNRPIPSNNTYFDYIIVGAGTAGCVLAGRLADSDPNSTVLLLEAGGPQSVITDMPGNTLYLAGGEFDWNYHVVPQRFAGLAYPNFSIPRGKVLGGSSTVNWDIYNRGNPRDYDNWSTQYGLTNLSWTNVLPYFLMWENETDSTYLSSSLHSNMGPVSVCTETKPDFVLDRFREAMNRVGYRTLDINGPSQYGTAIAQMFWNHDTGIKSTTANSYIENSNRTNLSIVTRAFVQQILLNGTLAHGVVFTKNGSTYHMHAHREVIISAGALNTPQVLMLSGIGPRQHLNAAGITVVSDLPVGNNLHDMVFTPLYYRITDPNPIFQINPPPYFENEKLYLYYRDGAGSLAHHADGVTYYSTPSNRNGTAWPDTMIISVVEFFNNLNATVDQYWRNRDEWRRYWQPVSPQFQLGYYLAVDPVLARPRSRGTVRLNTTNPLGPPLIDPNYLSVSEDFEAMFQVTRFAVETLRRYPLPYVVEFPPIPGCNEVSSGVFDAFFTDEYLKCHVRQLSRSYYNFVGTARMGLTSDNGSVVDPYFRVRGFQSLRVVDASVIPEIPNAHTNAAVLMLAEKAAQLIINDYQ